MISVRPDIKVVFVRGVHRLSGIEKAMMGHYHSSGEFIANNHRIINGRVR